MGELPGIARAREQSIGFAEGVFRHAVALVND